jgi:ubiquinone/menaquinone biosynthesis C-methylase UbiE
MKGTELIFNQLANYYDLIYSSKDYEKDTQQLKSLIQEFKKSDGNELLDVACGTGKHIFFLKDHFNCMGIDISDKILKLAKIKNPEVEFKKASMIDMDLGKKFDILTCLFSAIGCVKTYDNLKNTWENFSRHLKKGGIAIVEPWFFVPMSKQVNRFHEDENTQIAKLILSTVKDNLAIINFHYLIAEKNKKVIYAQDRHELGIFDIDITLEIMESAGFEAHYVPINSAYENQMAYVGLRK